MRKWIIVVIVALSLLATGVFPQRVAEKEIRSKAKEIDFENYTGPSRQRDSVAEVRAIGVTLAQNGQETRYLNRYRVIRFYDPKQRDKLSADLFIVEKSAKVDHIRNLRRILSSYLEARFKYNRSDAGTLATFITYYNAVYRGDVNYIKEAYIPAVSSAVTAENLGLAVSYKDWPGKTRMLIPLGENGADPDTLGDKKVIEELRKRDDRAVEDREKLIKIREKEVEKKTTELKKEKEKVETDKKKIEDKKKEIEKKKEEIKKTTEPEEKKKKEDEVKKEEEKIKKEEEKIQKKEEEIKKKEEKLTEKKEEIKEEKEKIAEDKKETELKKDPEKYKEELDRRNKELAEKEAELKKKEDELKQKNLFEGKLYYLRSRAYGSDGKRSNDMFIIDPKSRKILVRSPYEGIAGQKYDIFNNGVVVIGTNSKSGFETTAYRLVLLDPQKLQVLIQGDDNIFWRSFVEIRGDFIYAVIFENNAFYLGKFDKNLKRVAISAEKLHEDTFITFFEDVIYVNNPQKNIIVLKESDLSLIETINP